jgi:hypothetical protein
MRTIERVCSETGLTPDQVADLVLITPDTMRKIRKGYQVASPHVMALIAGVPEMPTVENRTRVAEEAAVFRVKAADPALPQKLDFILEHASLAESQMIRAMIETAYKQVRKTLEDACGPSLGSQRRPSVKPATYKTSRKQKGGEW